MDNADLDRAIAAAESVAGGLGLPVDAVAIVHNSNKLSLHLTPSDLFARVAPLDRNVAPFELDLAQRLAAVGAPTVTPDSRVTAEVFEEDGFAITWWTWHESPDAGTFAAPSYAQAMEGLHAGMRRVEIDAPHFLDRVAEAEQLVTSRTLTPELDRHSRRLLLDTFTAVRAEIDRRGAPEQLLHGEPHPGNLLDTEIGPRFMDFETCCFGPIAFDVAHAPLDVGAHYSGVDQGLLSTCRRLVLAMVAAWRWDASDEFPNGLEQGRAMVDMLADGPPWPALGDLTD